MISREDFIKEIKEYSKDIQDKLLKLYDYKDITSNSKKNDLDLFTLINEIMTELFNPIRTFNEPMIPFSFFQTNVGRFIVAAMSDIDNRMYSINDLIGMTKTKERPNGYTYQYLAQEIKAGRLKASKNNGRWEISHSEVERFLRAKGLK